MMNNSTTRDPERIYLNEEDCDSIFQIPPHLLESYGVNAPSKAWLRVDDSGKRWRVTIEKFKDCYFFTNGWKEFAEQVDLKSLAWLKFKPDSSSKQAGTSNEKTRKRIGDANVTTSSIPNENKDKCSGVGTELSFTKKIKKDYNLYKLCIPHKFMSDTRMQKASEIKLKDSEGKVWPIHMIENQYAPTMGTGWSAFVKDNKLMVGSTISFTWLSGNMLQARIVKERTDNGEGFGAEKIWSFCKNMKKHNQYCLGIPQDFARTIGLCKDEGIKLRNGEGREWPIGLSQKTKKHGLFTMTRGWSGFVIDNKVMLGSKVSFTWLFGNTLQTEISEVGTDMQQLYSTAPRKRKCL